ncbi:MAG: tetratricopeptide repeat protein, partial [Pirellulales bacterium]|nr:tetratricopeptide repeat protein [Pirellulales bacterium]
LRGDALIALGCLRDAALCLEQAAEIAPGNLHVWLSLGWCYKRIGQIDLAIAALEEAVAAEPSEAIAHYNLACYLSLAGDKSLALAHLARALVMDPNFRDQVATERDFDPLRSDADFRLLTGALA